MLWIIAQLSEYEDARNRCGTICFDNTFKRTQSPVLKHGVEDTAALIRGACNEPVFGMQQSVVVVVLHCDPYCQGVLGGRPSL
jgi:hypothetical protein